MTQSDIDELILRFSRRTPRNGNETLITLPSTSLHQAIEIQSPPVSSLGRLDVLPVEILDGIFEDLDLRSLSRIASCSHYGRNIVRSFRPYEMLVSLLLPTLLGMSEMHALHWYSCSELLSIFHSESCASCGEYAPYLFLLTSERICWYCMHENQAYWLIPLSKAKKLFAIKEKDLKGTRILRSLHGAKFIPPVRLGMRERLISAQDAKRAAIRVHGSADALGKHVRSCTYPLGDKYLAIWIRNAPLEPLGTNPSRLPVRRNRPHACDQYEGMGNILFPTASYSSYAAQHKQQRIATSHGPMQAEPGYWCLGCQARLNDTPDPPVWLHGMARRARSRAEFATHIRSCAGVHKLLGLESLEDDSYQPDYAALSLQEHNPISASLYGEFGVGVAGAWNGTDDVSAQLAATLLPG